MFQHQDNDEFLEKVFLRNKWIYYIKNDICIGKYLREGFYWESDTIEKYIRKYYKPNTNIIDLGAHIGTTAMMMCEILSDNCKIYCFEPIYNDILSKNIYTNGLENKVVIYPFGLGNIEDKYKLPIVDYRQNLNFGSVSIANGNKTLYKYNIRPCTDKNNSLQKIVIDEQVYQVDSVEPFQENELFQINIRTLDSFDIKNVGLIKIDVEGMEEIVIEGALNTISKYKPVLIIEIHDISHFKQTDICKKLINLGYNTIENVENSDHDFVFLCSSE